MPLNDNGINSGTYQLAFFLLQPFAITFEDLNTDNRFDRENEAPGPTMDLCLDDL
jgi:hypothetical protein